MRGLTPTEASVLRTLLAVRSGALPDRDATGEECAAFSTLIRFGRLSPMRPSTAVHGAVTADVAPAGREALRIHEIVEKGGIAG